MTENAPRGRTPEPPSVLEVLRRVDRGELTVDEAVRILREKAGLESERAPARA